MNWPGRDLSWKDFVKQLAHDFGEDAVSTTAAALTYFAVLALFPFLLFLVALASVVLDPHTITSLVQQLGTVAPPAVTQIVGNRLQTLSDNPSGGLLTIGIVGAFWSASGAVTSLTEALNRCYDVRETRPFWKRRGLALLVTLAAGIIVIITVAIMFFVPVLGHFIGGWLGALITWIRFPVGGIIVMALWALLYWALPNVTPHRFQLVSFGSLVGVVVWLLASWGFGEYVRHSDSYEATYGAVGGMIVMLVWMYISSLVVLLGAEMNKLLTPAERLKRAPTGEARAGGKEQPPVAQPRQPSERPEPSPA
jgi:membrane protein